ncbi:MAG: RNA-binding transcriptional accessory protein [Firmicutes bacterium]|nr:RNA-binding transcriptional accessory protein [Bacillota bacterium]
MQMIKKLAEEFGLHLSTAENTVKLLDEGNTVPFIARYRKEVTGGMPDVTLRELQERLVYLRGLEERKEEVIRLIEEQGKLTPELEAEIRKAEILQRVEDLYKPFKQKKATRASKAREKGLEPLADLIRAMELETGTPEDAAAPFVCGDPELCEAGKGAADAEQALAGACDIIAEDISTNADFAEKVREMTRKHGMLISEAANPEESTVYDLYYEYEEPLAKVPNHRVLAINRGEKEDCLKVKVKAPAEQICGWIKEQVIVNENSVFFELMNETVEDAYKRLMAPSAEREIRSELTERAEKDAVKVFAKNTEKLLMTPPVKGARVIAIDPGFRTGCKVAMLDETGKLLAYTTIYPTEPKKDIQGSRKTLKSLVDKYDANVIVIGNGTASRETEAFAADFIHDLGKEDLRYTIVSEAGASVYSASKLAAEEYPDLDVTTRGALSIGRRLQDPLAELVKVEPRHIGVGQYQHDISKGLLDGALTDVVENCVNRVGVDLNTASPSLLSYIAGINTGIAKNIVSYRESNGRFYDRKELKKVAKLGEKTFKQCAGFLRISGGSNPLDATAVHPESYGAAERMLEKLGISKEEIGKSGAGEIEEKIRRLYPDTEKKERKSVSGFAALASLAAEKPEETQKKLRKSMERMAEDLGIGVLTLSDIVSEIRKPARDPRDGAPPVVFRKDVLSIEDLTPGMELTGTVRNVVDFGAFVDIGVKHDGLVHISELSNRFIKHPMDAVNVGDTVKVRVLKVDPEKQKVSLTMKK